MITLLLIFQFLKCTTHYITVKILNITIATHPIAKDVAIVTNWNHVKASSTDMQHTLWNLCMHLCTHIITTHCIVSFYIISIKQLHKHNHPQQCNCILRSCSMLFLDHIWSIVHFYDIIAPVLIYIYLMMFTLC